MADDASSTPAYERRGGPGRGGRGGAPRGESRGEGGRGDAGGFRIRLSDNEMQAARALQEAFGLRSTVAVLGFCLRSLAQLLEQGKLDELIQQQRAQAASRPPTPGRDGERRGGRAEVGGGARVKADPFARPSRPTATPVEEPVLEEESLEATSDRDNAVAAGLDATEQAVEAPSDVDVEVTSDTDHVGSSPRPDAAAELDAAASPEAEGAPGSSQA